MVYFSIDYCQCFEVVAVLKLFVAFSLHWPTPIFPLRPIEAVYRFLIFDTGRSERPSNHDIIFAVKPDKISALKCYPPFSLHAWVREARKEALP